MRIIHKTNTHIEKKNNHKLDRIRKYPYSRMQVLLNIFIVYTREAVEFLERRLEFERLVGRNGFLINFIAYIFFYQ